MADNYVAKDATNTSVTFDSKDIGAGVQRPRVEIASFLAGAVRIGKVTIRNAADAADIDPLADATFTGRIGEVQATPTSFTLLARLKDLLTGIVLSAGAAIIGSFRDAGPHWTPTQTLGSSADASGTPVDITTAPVNALHAVIIDDLIVSAAADMVLTIRETSGANLYIFHYKTAMGPTSISPRNRLRASVNKKVEIFASVSGQIYTWASWHEE